MVFRNVTASRHRQSSLETYAAQILRAQEEERRRIAQELHDETMQSLVLLYRRLDAVEEQVALATAPWSGEVGRLRDDVESTIRSLRVFLQGLRPSILDDLGLTSAVEGLVETVRAQSPTRAAMTVSGASRRLPSGHEIALYRIAQETLHNVERHSEASEVAVTLSYLSHEVELSVSDDGQGFTPPASLSSLASENKLGLLGMQERARIVGGTLRIRSQPGAGTSVVATARSQASSGSA